MTRTFPEAMPNIAPVAAALADASRAAICAVLMDGRAWTPGELATQCGIARSTATEHLNRLARAGIIADAHQGRHRYVRLASPAVADVIEQLATFSEDTLPTASSLKASDRTRRFREGRTCYKHLAGRLGLDFTTALTRGSYLDSEWRLTDRGLTWTADQGFGISDISGKPCLDTTERRPHLAGGLGVALCRGLFDRGWIRRIGDSRAVQLTPTGRRDLSSLLDPS